MPVFVLGFARSGTTLCQRLVAERFALPTLPETHFFERLDHHLAPERVADMRLTRRESQALLDELAPYLPLKAAAREALLPARGTPVRALFLRLVEALLPRTVYASECFEQGLWLEKTPGHVWHMPRLLQLFPQARFIAMVRSPFTALASRRELAQPGQGWGEAWRPIEDYAADWARTQDAIWRFAQAQPERLLQVRLEDLSTRPDEVLDRVGAFLHRAPRRPRGLSARQVLMPFETWKQAALEPVDAQRAQRTGRSGLNSYERWRVAQLLAPQLQVLGYQEEAPPPPLDPLHLQLLATVDAFRPAIPPLPDPRPSA